jgi:hypothetical protein
MSIRAWWTSRRQRKLEAYDNSYGHATAEEQREIKGRRSFRGRLQTRATGGMPDGTGISPTGTPIDFTADQKPPRY